MPIVAINKSPMCPVKLSDYPLQTAKNACDQCIIILNTAIGILQQAEPNQEILTLVTKYFLSDGSSADVRQKLIAVLTLTRDGLRDTDVTLTLDNFNNARKGVPIVKIAPAQFRNANQLLRFMIHEATHAFAGTTDAADWGYINNDGEFRLAGIVQESAISNADSYAVFAVKCFNLPLA